MKKCIVAGCLVIDDGKILMMKHKKLGVWLPPGGHIEAQEFPDEAVIREVREETGLEVELFKSSADFDDVRARSLSVPFIIMQENVPYKDEPHIHFDMTYLARVVGGRLKQNSESTEIQWMDRKDVDRMETFENVRAVLKSAFASNHVLPSDEAPSSPTE